MPLTIRDKASILDSLLSHLLAGNIVSDIGLPSVTRQMMEGIASEEADRAYELWNVLRGWYLTTAEGADLDIRGRDYGLARDAGQAASDPVTYTKEAVWIDDVLLPASQILQATLADGTEVLYRSLTDAVVQASGRSVSGQAPGTTLTSGTNDQLALNLDGDGVRTVSIGTHTSAAGIAASIQAAVRGLTALTASHQTAYDDFRCDYDVTTTGAYTLRSGTAGPASTVVVTPAATDDASVVLKLGIGQGGFEQVGQDSLSVPVICDSIGVIGNVSAGQIHTQAAPVAGIATVANLLAFTNGREPASDDAYRQDVRSHLLALGRGTRDAMERAVYATLGEDGQRHVLTAQVVHGAGSSQVYVCDGRSVTVGAQPDTVQDVQEELDGLGETIGGWVPSGNVAGVTSAMVLQVPFEVWVTVGATPNLTSAQLAITNVLYALAFNWPVGVPLSYATAARRIDETVVEVVNIHFTLPVAFSLTPPALVGGSIGIKIMPSTIAVHMARA